MLSQLLELGGTGVPQKLISSCDGVPNGISRWFCSCFEESFAEWFSSMKLASCELGLWWVIAVGHTHIEPCYGQFHFRKFEAFHFILTGQRVASSHQTLCEPLA